MARTAAVAPHTERRHVVGRLRGLSVILPCHDEAQNVERAIDEATAAGELVADAHEILVVDDGSTDATRDLAQARAAADPRVRVLVHDGNRGYGAAVRTGIAAARLEWLFLTDADLQFEMAELTRFVPLAQSTDIIAGFRTHRADPPHRLLNAAAWNALVRRVFDVPVRDVDCAFKLMRRDLVQALPLAAEGAMVSTELVTRARDAGARIAELGVGHHPRMAGRSSGASPRVVLRAFRELRAVRAELREGEPAGAPADLSRAVPAGAPADLSRTVPAGAPADLSRAVPAGAPADLSHPRAA
jgi:GT2 family glycosyltransferase